MSRIAKNSIKLPEGTTCSFENNTFSVKGKLGESKLTINHLFIIKQEDDLTSDEFNVYTKKGEEVLL